MTSKSARLAWVGTVLLGFLAGLGTGRWIWKTTEHLPDSFANAQAQVNMAFSQGVQTAQIFTLGVAGSVALIVFLVAAILLKSFLSGRGNPKE
jgi:hypothetical protein